MSTGDILKQTHIRLILDLQAISQGRTSVSAAFEEILRIFEYHLEREEYTTYPLLNFLLQRSKDGEIINVDCVVRAWEGFNAEYEQMLSEHQQLISLLNKAEEFPGFRHNAFARDLVDEIRTHIALEEQVLFPAVMAAGELISPTFLLNSASQKF